MKILRAHMDQTKIKEPKTMSRASLRNCTQMKDHTREQSARTYRTFYSNEDKSASYNSRPYRMCQTSLDQEETLETLDQFSRRQNQRTTSCPRHTTLHFLTHSILGSSCQYHCPRRLIQLAKKRNKLINHLK